MLGIGSEPRSERWLAAAMAGLLATGATTTAAAESFKCPDTAEHNGDSEHWGRYGRTYENHRCTRSKVKVNGLARSWQISGLGAATSTPVVVGDTVYFGGGTFLRAVRAKDGKPRWSVDLGRDVRSTPTVVSGVVYVASFASVHAVDADDGALLWTTPGDTHFATLLDSSPIVVGGLVIIGVSSFENVIGLPPSAFTFRGSVLALDANTGAEVWRVSTQDATTGAGGGVWSSAAVDLERKMFYIGTGQAYSAPAGPRTDAVLAIDYETGDVVWTHQYTANDVWSLPPAGPGPDADVGATPTLLTVNGRDLVFVGSKGAIFKALDRDTGMPVWERVLGTGSAFGGVMTSTATDGKRLYVANNTWVDFGFSESGVHSPNDTTTVMALDPATGVTLWSVPLSAPMFGAFVVADGVVYQGLINGEVRGLDAETGAQVFFDTAPGPIGGGISVAKKRVHVSYGLSFGAFVTPDAGLITYE